MIEMEELTPEALEVIEKTRRLTRNLAEKVISFGVEPIDPLIGIAYALHDLSTKLTGNPVSAVEWQRSCLDLFERQHLQGVPYGTHPTTYGNA